MPMAFLMVRSLHVKRSNRPFKGTVTIWTRSNNRIIRIRSTATRWKECADSFLLCATYPASGQLENGTPSIWNSGNFLLSVAFLVGFTKQLVTGDFERLTYRFQGRTASLSWHQQSVCTCFVLMESRVPNASVLQTRLTNR